MDLKKEKRVFKMSSLGTVAAEICRVKRLNCLKVGNPFSMDFHQIAETGQWGDFSAQVGPSSTPHFPRLCWTWGPPRINFRQVSLPVRFWMLRPQRASLTWSYPPPKETRFCHLNLCRMEMLST
ncbi:Uncharacterized protein TCM_021644 [Theobroma cacao]|uniref:Uncharacterized protein n=1 Tax=Theobroma cacao TaxID=3641 RepID=A0A061EQL7_THECC|nr:Uncharacterized protein TCM_021644 [Theobroma cacao]